PAADHAELADWLVRHADLFGRNDSPERRELARLGREYADERDRLRARIGRVSHAAPALLDGNGVDEHVLVRGNWETPRPPAPRPFLEALAGPAPLAVGRGSGRLELTRQVTDPRLDPFLPRVFVNRVWHHLFGRGIVASVDNFGDLGERPTHPELLDHLT